MRLILFLSGFLGIYGGLHLYWLLKFRRALLPGPVATAVWGVALLVLLSAPVVVRLLERHDLHLPARLLAQVGYTWMGLLFLFCAAGLVLDLWRLSTFLLARAGLSGIAVLHPGPRAAFWIPLVCALGIGVQAFIAARDVRTERITIRSPKIPSAVGRLTVVQISDVHLGLLVGRDRLERIAARARQARPDILVSTGDLVDGQQNHLNGVPEVLRGVPAPLGRFAVTGNHEFYAGIDNALAVTAEAGFTVLRGQHVTLPGLINIAGVDDPAGAWRSGARPVSEAEALAGVDPRLFTLFLKHQPRPPADDRVRFDLQLSGHTHKGQLFPFGLLVKRFYPFDSGLFALGNGRRLYVSRGSGTWGPPLRFLSPPEVTVIELVHAAD